VLVSRDGSLIQVSPSGKKISENALMKRTPQAVFTLVAANNTDDFVIVKSDQGFIAAFDPSGKQLFEINNPASENLEFALYHISDGRDVLVVFDKDQNLFYACDLTGKMLIAQPQQASALPAVSYQPSTKTLTFGVPDQTRLVNISASF
jgi:hypothetical protein